MNKVYCAKCKWYGSFLTLKRFNNSCHHPSNISRLDTPAASCPYVIRDLMEINKNNDCKNFKKSKFAFISWLWS